MVGHMSKVSYRIPETSATPSPNSVHYTWRQPKNVEEVLEFLYIFTRISFSKISRNVSLLGLWHMLYNSERSLTRPVIFYTPYTKSYAAHMLKSPNHVQRYFFFFFGVVSLCSFFPTISCCPHTFLTFSLSRVHFVLRWLSRSLQNTRMVNSAVA